MFIIYLLFYFNKINTPNVKYNEKSKNEQPNINSNSYYIMPQIKQYAHHLPNLF